MTQPLLTYDLTLACRPVSLLQAALQAVLHSRPGAVGCVLLLGRRPHLWVPILTEPLPTGALTSFTFVLGQICAAALVVGHGALLTLNQRLERSGVRGASSGGGHAGRPPGPIQFFDAVGLSAPSYGRIVTLRMRDIWAAAGRMARRAHG